MLKVLIVDDHEIVSTGISRMLQDVSNLQVVGCAASGEEAISLTKEQQPDIVLMDVHMPGIGGLGATKEIKRLVPKTKVIALSALDDNPYPTKLIEAGASGYITKGIALDEMIGAIEKVAKGGKYISSDVAQKMALSQMSKEEGETPLDSLSDRELQIAQMIVDCRKVQDIAEKLNLSAKTVNTYRYRMFEKLSIGSDVELARLAMRHNLLGVGAVD
ncbi:response regulator [Marinomonas sp. SBI22]|uniref:UvrY/SirA/GacA family response regulator transcription factor n=1 Tax=unclassified Marinomonas TaxID=196814 RepID=UPI0005F9C994|nr:MULTISPECIES: UvrY/SirA/GacA family response regulator transcription factor [unclassified Marinomonas]KJZ09567.1 response regulator [Marinomonas sp. S3726]KZM44409.1 response regulator [Marinomonas sp. SBI22]KZM45567.1 response regulator [Marinomonas sp. SBI8L]